MFNLKHGQGSTGVVHAVNVYDSPRIAQQLYHIKNYPNGRSKWNVLLAI